MTMKKNENLVMGKKKINPKYHSTLRIAIIRNENSQICSVDQDKE